MDNDINAAEKAGSLRVEEIPLDLRHLPSQLDEEEPVGQISNHIGNSPGS